jgi:hypothetical protein
MLNNTAGMTVVQFRLKKGKVKWQHQKSYYVCVMTFQKV